MLLYQNLPIVTENKVELLEIVFVVVLQHL